MNAFPNNSVHVGDDYEADIIGAKNAGMYTVHLQRENKQQAPEADWIVSNLEELGNIFFRVIVSNLLLKKGRITPR